MANKEFSSQFRLSPIKYSRATITNAQIKALTIVDVIPAPANNEVLLFDNAVGLFDFLGGIYTGQDVGQCEARFEVGTWIVSGTYFENDQGALADDSDIHVVYFPFTSASLSSSSRLAGSWISDFNDTKGLPMTFHFRNNATPFGGGHVDNKITFIIGYRILRLPS